MPFSLPQLTMADEKPSLLTIPTETRLMIYDHLIKCTGTVTIFPQYDLAHHVDKQTIRLLHINRQIRLEVQEFFYQNQRFEFRSSQALRKFIQTIGPYNASIVRHVGFGSHMCRKAIDLFTVEVANALRDFLKSAERLILTDPSHGFFEKLSYTTADVKPGVKLLALAAASPKLAAVQVYLQRKGFYGGTEIHFVPKEVQGPEVEDDTGRVKIYRRWPGVYARDTGFTTNTMIELPSKEEMDAAVKTGIEARQSKRKPTPSKVKKRAKRRARSETARRTVDAQMASSLL